MTTAIEVHDLTVVYQGKPVLWGIDFKVPAGVVLSVVGPNGAGKSSLLKAMLGLVPPASGFVHFFGDKLSRRKNIVAYVPQRAEVDWDFPISVFDVVAMGRYGQLSPFARMKSHDYEAVNSALSSVEMSEFADRQISQLSGGQQQRVFMARALVQEASIFLLDEPFAGVDAATEKKLVAIFKNLKEQGKTVVCVHHDLNTVIDYFDWIVLLNLHMIAAGKTTDVFTSDNLAKTYGGRLGMLSELAEKLRQKNWEKRA